MSSMPFNRGIFDDENRSPSKQKPPSVIKSIVQGNKHKRNTSRTDPPPLPSTKQAQDATKKVPLLPGDLPFARQQLRQGQEKGRGHGRLVETSFDLGLGAGFQLPGDHPHASVVSSLNPYVSSNGAGQQQQPLGERNYNREESGGGEYGRMIETEKERQRTQDDGRSEGPERGRRLHKKTKSSVSLRSLVGGGGGGDRKERERVRDDKSPSDDASSSEVDGKKMKKSKSSTSLSGLLSKPRSSRSRKRRDEKDRGSKNKENVTPPQSAGESRTPIFEQFAAKPFQEPNGHFPAPEKSSRPTTARSIEEEISLYTPKAYSPSKARNFGAYEQPTLSKRPAQRERPKSEYVIGSATSTFFTEQRGASGKSASPTKADGWEERPSSEGQGLKDVKRDRTSKVMATVAKFDERSKADAGKKSWGTMEIESEFEALLDARNIPQNMRDKMRSLDTNIKADFIRKDRSEATTPGHDSSLASRPATPARNTSGPNKDLPTTPVREDEGTGDGKKSRPRSRTFTWSKGDKKEKDGSPSKKQKAENGANSSRPKSIDMSGSAGPTRSLTSSTSVGGLSSLSRPAPITNPDEFVSYLRKVQKPEVVEVGKLHKLRQLLRNETVAWVDTFISKGGMDEVVSLLHRIIGVEWREEHEDALLHETLLCLKALCTTSLALSVLVKIQPTLFPTLLNLLFDQEHKGPSEFATRAIIISLLFTYLSNGGPSSELTARANILLSYLRDPTPPDDSKPLNFIAEMRIPRPYKVWCKELVNVTKEVFWIFLHHLNVIPKPDSSLLCDDSSELYASTHFPKDRPPVPAAPYVGGVEWDATNYLTTHLDLLNGLIASQPTLETRNALRTELRDSGFEKCMGVSLRTCKEKLYGGVHDALRTWVAAGMADGWDVQPVREGPKRESPKKGTTTTSTTSAAGNVKGAAPRLDVKVEGENGKDGDWL